MGNDGGSIPTRRELVKEAARNPTASQLKESRLEQQDYHWSTDPLTTKPLARPVVSDSLGRLFNKDAVIEFLLSSDDGATAKKAEQEQLLKGAIKSLKDVVDLHFELDSSARSKNGATSKERWICPITNKELGSSTKAVYLVPCGHVFSDVAIKQVADDKCLQCSVSYAPNDVIPILATEEADITRLLLRNKTLLEKGLTHSLKKAPGSKKRKKHGADAVLAEEVPELVESTPVAGSIKLDRKPPTQLIDGGIKNAATASLTAKVLQEQELLNKRRKMDKNENLRSLFSSKSNSADGKGQNKDFMSRGFSIPAHQR